MPTPPTVARGPALGRPQLVGRCGVERADGLRRRHDGAVNRRRALGRIDLMTLPVIAVRDDGKGRRGRDKLEYGFIGEECANGVLCTRVVIREQSRGPVTAQGRKKG